VDDRLPTLVELKRAAAQLWPERRLTGLRFNHEGWANLILETRQGIVFRFPRRAEVARGLAYEQRLLDYVGPRISVAIPRPLRQGRLDDGRGWPFVAYTRLPGVPLAGVRRLPRTQRLAIRNDLGRFLGELARLPTRSLRRLGCPAGDPRAWGRRYAALRERFDATGAGRLPPRLAVRVREDLDRFARRLPQARYRPVLSHIDLGPWNILWDRRSRRVSGVIDWEDAAFADPAFDLTGLDFLGDDLLEPLVAARRDRGDDGFLDRLGFYRRAVGVHDLLHAVDERDPRALRRTIERLTRSYAPGSGP
jgi:aminoglycoside 2''-phosphotransferase